MKYFPFGLLFLGLVTGAFAQPAVERPSPAIARTRVAQATQLAKAGDAAATETVLRSLNRAKPDSAAWHMESAQRLMHVAEQLAREGTVGSVPALAQRALQLLATAETRANDAKSRASARNLAGFIQERYLGNQAAALAHYEAAAALLPESAKAKESADRLKRTQERTHARATTAGN